MITIQQIISTLEQFAPPVFQESYDNARLITGDRKAECTGIVISLDATEDVIQEAIDRGCNMVVAHHPIVFSGLKSLTGKNYVERVIIKAIKNDIAIYAIHTNLDNVKAGVNRKIADKLGLKNCRILAPKSGLMRKLFTYVPTAHTDRVLDALFGAGAGQVGNYSECSYRVLGTGTFKGGDDSDPFVGEKGKRHHEEEHKIEVLFSVDQSAAIMQALKESHPYEEVAYEVVALENDHPEIGSGMIGELPEAVPALEFLQSVKKTMQTACIRHTDIVRDKIRTVALCGGAGSFLLSHAIRAKADIFITGDYKYHQFFDADGQIIIADIGHYESEQFTGELIYDRLSQKFGNFALHLSKVNTNPINYL